MVGLNPANTNVSPYVGVSANPRILWQTYQGAVSTYNGAMVLDSRGVLYTPNNSPVWAASGQPVSFLKIPFGNSGTPAIDATGNIYHWEQDRFRAYRRNGLPLWSSSPTDSSDGICPKIGDDGTIYALDFPGNVLHVYNPDGTEEWSVQALSDNAGFAAPSIDADGNIYLSGGHAGGGAYKSYDADGNLRWQSSWNEGWNFGTVILGPDGYLYSSEDYGTKVYVRDPNTGAVVRQQANLYGGIQAISQDGTLYSAHYHTLRATDLSGAMKWQATVPSDLYLSYLVVDAAGQVFCLAGEYQVEDQILAFSNTGEQLWSLQLPYGYGNHLPPVIGSDGTIYVHDGNRLLAIVPESGSGALLFAAAVCLLPLTWKRWAVKRS